MFFFQLILIKICYLRVLNLEYASKSSITGLENNKFDPLNAGDGAWLVMLGKYKVSMSMYAKGEIKKLVSSLEFIVKPLDNTTLPAPDRKALVDFRRKVSEITRVMIGAINFNEELIEKVNYLKQAIISTPLASNELLIEKLKKIATVDIKNLEGKLEEVKAPWTLGRIPVIE